MELIVGIDGGGTKTAFLACDIHGKVIKSIVNGPSNPVDIGIENAGRVLKEGIKELAAEGAIVSLYAGLSGGITGDNKTEVHKLLKSALSAKTIVDNHTDGLNSLLYEADGGDGNVVIAGTGTVGFMKRGDTVSQIGGYGYLFDKGGSGFDYGRDAIYAALCHRDAVGEATLITDMIEDKIGDVKKAIPRIYEGGKSFVASFARLVFEAYKMNDSVAKKIVDNNSKAVAELFNRIAARVEKGECKVVLTGSIFKSFDIIGPHLEKYLEGNFSFIFPKAEPVCGAVLKAAVNYGIEDMITFKENMKEGIK